jgi:hypothetical protein
MKHWGFYDWFFFIFGVSFIALVVGIFLPLFIYMAKASWAWLLGI